MNNDCAVLSEKLKDSYPIVKLQLFYVPLDYFQRVKSTNGIGTHPATLCEIARNLSSQKAIKSVNINATLLIFSHLHYHYKNAFATHANQNHAKPAWSARIMCCVKENPYKTCQGSGMKNNNVLFFAFLFYGCKKWIMWSLSDEKIASAAGRSEN